MSLGATLRDAAGDHTGAARGLCTAIVHEAGTGNRNILAGAVKVAAVVLAGRSDSFEAAATLTGAVDGPLLSVFPAWLTPSQLHLCQQRLAQVATALGPGRYRDARQRGAAMSYDEIIAYALDQLTVLGALTDR